ncbi:hypothetical protein AB0N07_13020 [Streptomyces sp. NPDC051172]|uniref:hypothetical protein n=1 Tax=Streptomyces sp. NPDC051172 TaxID=3155796 RepID=UPI00341B8335
MGGRLRPFLRRSRHHAGPRSDLAATALERAGLLRRLAREAGWDTGRSSDHSCIVPVIVGDDDAALRLADRMFRRGVSVYPFVSPVVERNQSRLRFLVTAQHSEAQVRAAAETLTDEWPLLTTERTGVACGPGARPAKCARARSSSSRASAQIHP